VFFFLFFTCIVSIGLSILESEPGSFTSEVTTKSHQHRNKYLQLAMDTTDLASNTADDHQIQSTNLENPLLVKPAQPTGIILTRDGVSTTQVNCISQYPDFR